MLRYRRPLSAFLSPGTGVSALATLTITLALPAQVQFSDLAGQKLSPDPNSQQAVTLGDIDGDGDLDIVYGNAGQNRLYRNDGYGKFLDVTSTQMPADADSTAAAALGDVDQDGDLDLLLGNGPGLAFTNARQDRLYINDGNGTFVDATATQLPIELDSTEGIALGDVDGDGDLDAAVVGYMTQRLYLNDGAGHFTGAHPGQLPGFSWGRDVEFGDLDGDGDLDLLSGNQVFRNNGSGTFTDVTPTTTPVGFTFTALADVDGDNDLDVLGLRSSGSPHLYLKLFRNDGAGVFRDVTTTTIPANTLGRDLALGDVDGDGDLDIVLSGRSGSFGSGSSNPSKRLCLNDGAGSFTDASSRLEPPSSNDSFGALALGDLDGDRDVDLIHGNAVARIEWNLQHQLHASTALHIGQPWTLDAYIRFGPPSQFDAAMPFLAFAPASISVPGFGILGIDPVSAVALPVIPIAQPSGKGTLSIAVPNQLGLVGLAVFTQALFEPYPFQPRLSSVVADTVR